MSAGTIYERGSQALQKRLAQDLRPGMSGLELRVELANLLEQRVHVKCPSTSTGRWCGGSPDFTQ